MAQDSAARSFGVLDESYDAGRAGADPALLQRINEAVVGRMRYFESPFGRRPVVYCDWTASGRALAHVEEFMRAKVMPLYGNTHTTTSITGLQTTCFRHEARQVHSHGPLRLPRHPPRRGPRRPQLPTHGLPAWDRG